MTTVLSIGTTHPWNIAGVGLDQRIGADLGARVLTVTVAVSAQDAAGMHALAPVAPEIVQAQLDAIPWHALDAVRTGAIGVGAAAAVARALAECEAPIVVDPVMAATGGGALSDGAVMRVLTLLPQAVITPNLDEAAALLGRSIDRASMEAAARALYERGPRAVLLKGGHLDGAPRDVLVSERGTRVIDGERIAGSMRGTGCTLAMALACALARGEALDAAVDAARAYVREKIASAVEFCGVRAAYFSADD
jgi:hydroxymethylpyrimidine/phosphomethylpyrimidine kinase